MLSKEEETYILSKAYVPEHIPKMMSFLSDSECFLIDEKYLIFQNKEFLIFIGYPLDESEHTEKIQECIKTVLKKFKPMRLFILTDKSETKIFKRFRKVDEDFYYVIDIEGLSIDKKLLKIIEKAEKKIRIKIERQTTDEHRKLTEDFLMNKNLPENVKELYRRLPEYMKISEGIFYLSAYSWDGKLVGYYIVETEAKKFSAYMIGATSKINNVPHTSDYLMYQLIRLSKDMGKENVNLGIGVNEGISRFKEKWGAKKTLKYEVYEYQSFSAFIFKAFGIRI